MRLGPWYLVEVRVKGNGESMTSSRTLGFVGKKIVDLAGRTVICDDGVTFVVHVQNQVLTLRKFDKANRCDQKTHHDGEADEADITTVMWVIRWGMQGEETYVGAVDIVVEVRGRGEA